MKYLCACLAGICTLCGTGCALGFALAVYAGRAAWGMLISAALCTWGAGDMIREARRRA